MRFNDSFIPGLGKSGPVVAAVVGAANDLAQAVRSTAPVDSGDYVSKVRVEVKYTAHRVVARVVAGAEHAMVVESREGTLARALNSVSSG